MSLSSSSLIDKIHKWNLSNKKIKFQKQKKSQAHRWGRTIHLGTQKARK